MLPTALFFFLQVRIIFACNNWYFLAATEEGGTCSGGWRGPNEISEELVENCLVGEKKGNSWSIKKCM